MPSAANGRVSARNVSGASSVTPIFRIGQLQPQTSVRMSDRQRGACRRMRDDRGVDVMVVRGCAIERSRSVCATADSPYLPRCSARACVTHASRRMRPGNSAQLRVDLVDVALAPARDLAIRRDAELVQHALDHGADADDELQVVGRAGRIEQRRRRIVLDIDDELAIACRFGARVGELAEEPPPVFRECPQLRELGERRRPGGSAAAGGSSRSRVPIRRCVRVRVEKVKPRSQYVVRSSRRRDTR